MKKINVKNVKIYLFLIILISSITGCGYHSIMPLPEGISYQSPVYNVEDDDVDFLYDLSYSQNGQVFHNQEIFDTVFTYIDSAKQYILIDMFLFNSYIGKADIPYRRISQELKDKLIEKKKTNLDIEIDFITDPINTVYGGAKSAHLEEMKAAGINVIITDLRKLRDSHYLYSAFWRTFIQWFGNSTRGGIFPNPFSDSERKVTLRTYLDLLNFKANHRKIFIADNNDDFVAIVTSANPHDGSSAHSNVAIFVKGDFAKELYISEKAVAKFSKSDLNEISFPESDSEGSIKIRLITEKKINDALLKEINKSTKGDSIKMGMFYLSKRDIVKSLISASKRGVGIKIILDPNKDAFGRKKNGVPNRPVAAELVKKSKGKIDVRWYKTSGEQFHTKMVYFDRKNGQNSVILGSANLTKRNIGNYNLETDVYLLATADTEIIQEIDSYYNKIWSNDIYSASYETYADNSFLKKILYRLTETLGASTY